MTAEPRHRAALLSHFPGLADRLPWLALATLPTPLQPLPLPDQITGGARVWVKRDDLSAADYGGNKVRKLELILAEARRAGASHVLTFGAAGSNHVLATALHGRRLGLKVIGVMTHQANIPTVGRNLLGCLAAGARLHAFDGGDQARAGARAIVADIAARTGREPMVVPMGGSSELGTIGFVNAGFELADQTATGAVPVPDRIYLALGTMGTCVGLALGLAAASLPTRVVPVRVVHPSVANPSGYSALYEQTAAALRRLDPEFPLPRDRSMAIRHDFFGEQYGVFTSAGRAAVTTAAGCGLGLEGTYTGKAFAALLSDLSRGELAGRDVMFWNTYNSADRSAAIAGLDYRALPPAFHRYFETRPESPTSR